MVTSENPGDLGCAIDLGPTGTGFSTMGGFLWFDFMGKTIGKP